MTKHDSLDQYATYLVKRVQTQLTQNFHGKAKELGATVDRWRVLAALHFHGPLNVSQLADRANTEISTLSHLLTRMMAEGLVQRQRYRQDARVKQVELTPRGLELALTLLPLLDQHEDVALRGFSAEEVATVKQLLRRMVENMRLLDSGTGIQCAPFSRLVATAAAE
ncbi:MAG: MarR family winged helix-turn-helix transcriptional regulator [Alphaproteobacteria bacterium]